MAGFVGGGGGGGQSEWTIENGALIPADSNPVGSESNPVPGTSHFEAISTGETRSNINDGAYQSAADGLLVPVGDGLGIGDAIDPANSSNALADMMDLFAAESTQGKILLPGSFNVSGQVDMTDGVGFEGVSSRGSIITQTDPSADLLAFGARGDVREASFSNFALEGPGDGAATGSPIVFTNSSSTNGGVSLSFDDWKITKWANAAIRSDGAQPFEIDWGRGRIGQVDAGNVNALIDPSGGTETPGWTFQNLACYPTKTASGANSRLYYTSSQTQGASFQYLNLGGSLGQIYQNGNRGFIRVGFANYVPTNQATTPANLFRFNRDNVSSVGGIVVSGNCDYVYRLNNNAGNKTMGPVENKGTNIGSNVVEIASDTTATSTYAGVSAEVDNNFGNLSYGVACQGDLTIVS